MMEPASEQAMIDYYNNNFNNDNGARNREIGQLSSESQLQIMLINTKFQIDKHLSPDIKISDRMQACILGKNYSNQALYKQAFSNLIWLTYRRNFAPLLVEKNHVPKLTTDSGWGCVIRCTQMLIANCLRRVYGLERQPASPESLETLSSILRLFNDDKRNLPEHAFSIQNVVEVGLNEFERLPGEWYGVSKMNAIFRLISQEYYFSPFVSKCEKS